MAHAGGQKYSLFHGTEEDRLKLWHSPYADMFAQRGPVLDVGCGLGYFADLLRDRGTACLGLDIDPEMVRASRERGHEAIEGDDKSVAALPGIFRGIHLSHVIEHVWGDDAVRLLETCAEKLAADGILVIRTPNWGNRHVRRHVFWLDHTHKRPYPVELLTKLLTDIGMHVCAAGAEPYGLNDLYVVARKGQPTDGAQFAPVFTTDPLPEYRELFPPEREPPAQHHGSLFEAAGRIYRAIARRL
jgi:SAM-dependent methyltransferase